MNCAEFERLLPDLLDGACNAEQHRHLRSCVACSELVSDLKAIATEARSLQACDEPSPQVWNSIEMQLRREGVIHEARPVVAVRGHRWHWGPMWLMPAAAALLFTVGIVEYRGAAGPAEVAQPAVTAPAPAVPTVRMNLASHYVVHMPKDDLQVLQVVGARSPALRDMYATDLQNINQYIQDAEESAQANPDDEEMQRYLMNAYEQKTMVYEMALDRTLP